MMNNHARKRTHLGYTLLEVLIGMAIFALGMMALAQLQGSLARNSSDGNARTIATNIAEEQIEAARMFSQITSDGVHDAYNDIVDSTQSISRGGIDFTVATDVTDYYYANGSFSTTAPIGAATSDMKLVELTVTWNSGQEFMVDRGTTTSGRLGSGAIELSDVISSITAPSGGKVALGTAGDTSYGPPVDYNPGENPDIVSIELGENKFKESTTPLPDVVRDDELVETRFDVVTYSQNDEGATFLRREEFRTVSCECTMQAPSASTDGGLRPTIWNGNDYSEGEFVSKPYGTEANNQQSEFCGICCRDHHDGGTGASDDAADPGKSLYNPFRYSGDYQTTGALAGDHKHYRRTNTGVLQEVTTAGTNYVEACRLIRKDGFWRVAQDLRQEGLNSFPANYLDDDSEVSEYSDYVTGAVSQYEADVGNTNMYEQSPPSLTPPSGMDPSVVFPASSYATATVMRDGVLTQQQLRSRGIYIDYMSDELRSRINCLDLGFTGDSCGVPDVTSAIEIIPFYDVQLTWLSRWNESPNNNPIDVTNEAVADDNTHSRGLATLGAGYGYSTINTAVHKGNLGLTATDPIDLRYASDLKSYDMYALAVDYDSPPPLSGITIAGNITSAVNGLKATDAEISAEGAQCDRTNTGYECSIEVGATNPRLTVYNYYKRNRDLYACSDVLSTNGQSHSGSNPLQSWTRFDLPLSPSTTVAHIVIGDTPCS
jgi:prepilin-type N-terminal cleavage/methylation domain-containing protein